MRNNESWVYFVLTHFTELSTAFGVVFQGDLGTVYHWTIHLGQRDLEDEKEKYSIKRRVLRIIIRMDYDAWTGEADIGKLS